MSTLGLRLISDKLSELIFRINNTNKKVLLLDCDNTLWGGVIERRWYRKYPTWTRWGGTSLHGISKGYKKITRYHKSSQQK